MSETGGKNMKLCPFCKAPPANSDAEEVKRIKKLMEKGNAYAYYTLAGFYAQGILGMSQDRAKANKLSLKACELGCAESYFNLGINYDNGIDVEIDKKKARHSYELAAMGGSVNARHNLGFIEGKAGKYDRAFKHYIIAARAGSKRSLDTVKQGYMRGYVTKEEYANTLREYQKSLDEMTSDARDKALTARNQRIGG